MHVKKNLLITAAFAVVSALALAFIGCNSKSASLTDGTYKASSEGRNGPIVIEVTVAGGKVTAAKVVEEKETDFAKPAEEAILAKFVSNGGKTSGIDAVSGATITSKAVLEALKNALVLAQGKEEKVVKAKDTSCDIVIIGAGGAGLTAATEAASKGKKVIVLEKMATCGGNTISATGGLNASETSIQKKLGIEDSNDSYFNDTMKGGYNKNNPELVRNMVEKSAATVDWLISIGADLTDVGKMAGSSNKRTHRPQGGAAVGAHLVPVLVKAAETAGAEIRLNSKVTDIIEENGRAAGVKVSSKNGDYTIKAKAVIIAAGGFGANPDMIVSYNANLKGFGTTNHRGATGDAFAMVKKFNAALTQMEEIQTHPTVVPGNGTMITEAVRGNGAILVNRDGKRFCTEMATRDVMSKAILEQKGQTAFIVFDEDVRKSLKAIEGYVKNGLLTIGETKKELAEKLNIPADAFESTMKEYELAVNSGNDPLGRRQSEMPRPLTEGPFYACEIGPAIHHTMGGIVINTKAEVLDANGNPVPGLYAAGEVTGGIHGGNRLGGNAVADICIYGKIAADSACE
ncbi:flavocytochrome c [Treponema sp.]|uniref:flavocytochrome c n=1 Tax=Treponema sp. TaxID=166 RepID=UPI00298DA490|nr:flavocytochrome c [Treponema sp.]MCQ2240376.1 flavocytochrome c [Treponema sp.]